MPIQGILVGRDATAYWNEDDSTNPFDNSSQTNAQAWLDLSAAGNATLTAENIMDLTDNIDSEMADSTTRAEAKLGWTAEIAVLKNGQVQFDFRWELGDAFTTRLINAWDTGQGISMAFMDQPAKTTDQTDAQGLGGIFSVSISKTENLRDIQKATATLSIAKNPLWVITNNMP